MNGNDADVGQLLRGSAPADTAPEGETTGTYADARELERIVDVAEALGIDPQTARMALRADDGDVPTDDTLSDAISTVVARLRGPETATPS